MIGNPLWYLLVPPYADPAQGLRKHPGRRREWATGQRDRQAPPPLRPRDQLEGCSPVRRVAVTQQSDGPDGFGARDPKSTDRKAALLLDHRAGSIRLIPSVAWRGHDREPQSGV